MAQALIGQGRHLEAAEEALSAVGLLHRFPQAHYHLGFALAELGQLERSRMALRTCRRMAPAHEQAAERLAEVEGRLRGGPNGR